MPLSEFRDFLEAAAKRSGSKRKLAKAIGISPGRLSRVLAGEHSIEVERCFVLAKVTGESPLRVLRFAGKGEIADQIEEAYGPNRPSIKPAERALLDQWDALGPGDRVNLEGILTALSSKGKSAAAEEPRKKHGPSQRRLSGFDHPRKSPRRQ